MSNYGFEISGASPGLALGWTSAEDPGAEDIAIFGIADGRPKPVDDFEHGWLLNQLSQTVFVVGDTMLAMFEGDSIDHEAFEYSWLLPRVDPFGYATILNHGSITEFSTGDTEDATFAPGAKLPEDFESDYSNNQNSQLAFLPADVSYAMFDAGAEAYEDFEENWNQTAVGAAFTTVAAMFDAGMNAFESFEVWTSKMVL